MKPLAQKSCHSREGGNPGPTITRKRVITKIITVITLEALLLTQAMPAWAQQTTTSTYEYDATGNLTKRTDPRTLPTTQSYDSLNRLRQQTLPAPLSGASAPQITIGVDGKDQVTSVKDPRNLTTNYTVTGLGDTTSQVSPDTGTTGMSFDPTGNLKTRVDARNKNVIYTYDALNRVTKIDYPTGTDTLLEYDGGTVSPPVSAKGKLTKLTDESGNTVYSYDALSRLSTKTVTIGSGTTAKVRTLTYGYGSTGTALGKLSAMTYPSGNRLNYSYDAAGQVSSITLNPTNANGIGTNTTSTINLLQNLTYEPTGAVNGWQWGNHTTAAPSVVTRTYDLDGRLTKFPLGHTAQGGLFRTVVYDAASRITNYTHTLASTGAAQTSLDHAFNYDDGDRLTQCTQNTTIHTYSYDLSGNRQTLGIVGLSPYTYTTAATSNRLTTLTTPAGSPATLPSKTNTYDAAGNLTSDNTVTLTYSDRGRLANIKKTVAGTVKTTSYLFNGLEQRLKKSGPTDQVTTGTIYYAYDEASHTIGEYDANLKVIYETVYLGDTPVAVLKQQTTGTAPSTITTTSVYYVYSDQIDTPRVITRATDNKMVWRWDSSDPFGLFYPAENPSALAASPSITYAQPAFTYNNRFPGQTYDRESGLHYNYYRDYDPYLGRYIQSDPIGMLGGINTYAYVGSSPTKYSDPSGLIIPIIVGCAASGACVAGVVTAVVGGIAWAVSNGPGKGAPGSWGSEGSKERYYGPDGWPDYDIDWHNDHGAGNPHGHNWDRPPWGGPPDANDRNKGVELSPWPKGRKKKDDDCDTK
jgi:RHS repeat-associated protein